MKMPTKIIHFLAYTSLTISGVHFPISPTYANETKEKKESKPKVHQLTLKDASEYTPKSLCEGDAKDVLKELNLHNKSKIERVKDLDQRLKDELHSLKIINDAKQIRSEYEKRVAQIGKNITSKSPAEMSAELDDLKSSVRNGMVLQALSLTLKNVNLDNVPKLDMQSLCQSSKEALCSLYQSGKGTPEMEQMDRTLSSFHETYKAIKTPNTRVDLKDELKKITSSIPQEISPALLLEHLMKESPSLSKALMVNNNKDKILNCLTAEDNTACKSVIDDKDGNKAIKKLLGDDISRFKQMISKDTQNLASKIVNENYKEGSALLAKNYINNGNKQEEANSIDEEFLEKSIHFINDSGLNTNHFFTINAGKIGDDGEQLSKEQRRENIRNNMLSGLKGKELLFFRDPILNDPNIDDVDYEKLVEKSIQESTQNIDYYDKHCADATNARNNKLKCYHVISGVEDRLKQAEEYQTDKVNTLKAELDEITNDKDFNATENLKAFITYQYDLYCKQKNHKKIEFSQGLTCNATDVANIQQVDLLDNDMIEISNYLDKKNSFQMESNVVAVMKKSCNDAKDNVLVHALATQRVCDAFINYDQIQAKKKQNEALVAERRFQNEQKMAQIEKDYHLQYNRSTGRYQQVKKKSIFSTLATGIIPQAGLLMNGLAMNSQAKVMIPYLQDQGIYQKQLLHNINFFNSNPWAYGLNYFNGAYGINSGLNGSLFNNNILNPSTTGISSGFSF